MQSVELHVTATIPRAPRIGSRSCASATVMKSTGTPTVAARFTSCASCSASRSVRAIFSAPLCVKRNGSPVSSVNAASLATARCARRVSAGVARTWLVRPAARGDVCDARAKRSSTATRAPRLARWYATLAPNAPEPTTTTSAEAIMGVAILDANAPARPVVRCAAMQIRLTPELEERARTAGSMTVEMFLARFPEVPRDLKDEPILAAFVRAFGPQLAVAQKPSPCVARDGGGDAPHFFYTRLVNDLAIYGIGLAKRERTLQRLEKLLAEYGAQPATFACTMVPRKGPNAPPPRCS